MNKSRWHSYLLVALLPKAWSYPCALPNDIGNFSLIAEGDAKIEAESVTPGMYVGLVLQQVLLDNEMQVNGMSYIRDMQADNVHWNGGLRIGSTVAGVLDFKHYEFLAENLEAYESASSRVFVLNDNGGGCWTNEDFGTPTTPGNTLVVFNTWQDVCFFPSDDGSPFYPTILAPFSRVELDVGMGIVSGTIVAREIEVSGYNQEDFKNLTFHSIAYTGEVACRDTAAPSLTPTVSAIPSDSPSSTPTISLSPSAIPSDSPSNIPSDFPSLAPSAAPSFVPSDFPSFAPSAQPSTHPSSAPSGSYQPSDNPSSFPSLSIVPSNSLVPSDSPSSAPSSSHIPSALPSSIPSDLPSRYPSQQPSDSQVPSMQPSNSPTSSAVPSDMPSLAPSESPSMLPSIMPSGSLYPSALPSHMPSESKEPSAGPSRLPSATPSFQPSGLPSSSPSSKPSSSPSTSVPTPAVESSPAETKPPALVRYYDGNIDRTNPLLRGLRSRAM